MKEKLKKLLEKFKEFWKKLSSGVKKLLIAALSILVVGAIVLTVALNIKRNSGYIVLFPDMDASESAEVYQYLTAEGVPTKMENGDIMVPKEQWDTLVYKLAQKGYPQSAPSYGTYFDNLSMTMTDSEKQQLIIKDLQDRLQITLNRIDGIKGSVVTISAPEKSSYAWKDNETGASASVALTLENPNTFTSENVSAVKNLVAFATQQMKPEDVIVIDTTTGKELGVSAAGAEGYDIVSRENYERIIRERIEESVENILSRPYGQGNVVAACTVSVNYDKINEEMLEYLTNEDGEGVVDWKHIIYQGAEADDILAGGVSGEENNTDIPSYPNEEEELINADPEYLERELTYSIGHVLTQTEKAQGIITDSTIAITIKTDVPLSVNEKNNIVDLVRNATAIDDAAKITVFDWQSNELEPNPDDPVKKDVKDIIKDSYYFILLMGLLGVILLALLIIFLINRNAKKKIKANQQQNQTTVNQLEAELEETRRRTLAELANETNKEQKETTSEVRRFAQDNPDLTAAIVRSMIAEDEMKNSAQEDEEP